MEKVLAKLRFKNRTWVKWWIMGGFDVLGSFRSVSDTKKHGAFRSRLSNWEILNTGLSFLQTRVFSKKFALKGVQKHYLTLGKYLIISEASLKWGVLNVRVGKPLLKPLSLWTFTNCSQTFQLLKQTARDALRFFCTKLNRKFRRFQQH